MVYKACFALASACIQLPMLAPKYYALTSGKLHVPLYVTLCNLPSLPFQERRLVRVLSEPLLLREMAEELSRDLSTRQVTRSDSLHSHEDTEGGRKSHSFQNVLKYENTNSIHVCVCTTGACHHQSCKERLTAVCVVCMLCRRGPCAHTL